jgi:hypothetical protein
MTTLVQNEDLEDARQRGYPCAVEFDDGIVVELLGGFVNSE